MKKLNHFFENEALWKVYLILFLVILLLTFPLNYILWGIIGSADFVNILFFSITLSGVVWLFSILMIRELRKTVVFWDSAKKLEEKITNLTVHDSLDNVMEDFDKLEKLSLGGHHRSELLRLKSIIDVTKRFREKMIKSEVMYTESHVINLLRTLKIDMMLKKDIGLIEDWFIPYRKKNI